MPRIFYETMRNRRSAFTLVEVMVVVAIIGIIAAIAVPNYLKISQKSKESALKTDLQVYRSAVYVFFSDTGLYPASLSDLTVTTAPATGFTAAGGSSPVSAASWRGPYIQSIHPDPVSNSAFNYSTSAGTVGQVKSSATGNDTNGIAFSTY